MSRTISKRTAEWTIEVRCGLIGVQCTDEELTRHENLAAMELEYMKQLNLLSGDELDEALRRVNDALSNRRAELDANRIGSGLEGIA